MKLTVNTAHLDGKKFNRSHMDQLPYFQPDELGITKQNAHLVVPVATVKWQGVEWVLVELGGATYKVNEYWNRGFDRTWGSPNKLPRIIFT